MTTENETLRTQAAPYLESITALVKPLRDARVVGSEDDEDDAIRFINEDAIAVNVRSDWHEVGGSYELVEFSILIAAGGPAFRITGELEGLEPSTARLEFQDWGIPWTHVPMTEQEREDALEYARCFYFGA